MMNIRVLIADEHPAFREGLRQAIGNAAGLEVVATAGDGESVINQAANEKLDVALLSVTLPKIDGVTVTKKLREIIPDIGVILISPYSQGSYIVPALRAGALGYLTKTSPLEEIISCIRSVKEKEIVIDSRAVGKLLRLMIDEPNQETKYVEKLHPREMEVLSMIAKGMHNRDIAGILGISNHTVHSHINSIFRKLEVNSRTEALIQALKMGWVSFDDLT